MYAYCIAPSGRRYRSMEWPAETVERLQALWEEGWSTAKIGRHLGVTKNAVVGKVHRLNLPKRGSPIKYTSEPRPRKPRRRPERNTLPLLACLNGPTPTPAPSKPYVPKIVHPEAKVERPVAAKSVFVTSRHPCCWPLGDPKDKENFRFCSAPSVLGRPYCAKHCEVAYIRVRDRREDEAA